MNDERNAVGRPTKFDPSYVKIARAMCKLGATDRDLAEAFEVSTVSIWRWASTHPQFARALRVGKGDADERVVRSLYQRAVGYSYDAVKVFHHCGSPVVVPYVEHVPPDPGAAFKWLCSRRPDEWREKVTVDGLPDVAPFTGIEFVVVEPPTDDGARELSAQRSECPPGIGSQSRTPAGFRAEPQSNPRNGGTHAHAE